MLQFFSRNELFVLWISNFGNVFFGVQIFKILVDVIKHGKWHRFELFPTIENVKKIVVDKIRNRNEKRIRNSTSASKTTSETFFRIRKWPKFVFRTYFWFFLCKDQTRFDGHDYWLKIFHQNFWRLGSGLTVVIQSLTI